MFNLKNYLWDSDYGTSAYEELAMMVVTFGIEDVLQTISEIYRNRGTWNERMDGHRRIVTIEGKDYWLPNGY